jgi:uncharacterized repeat protein (TIGR03803 family)
MKFLHVDGACFSASANKNTAGRRNYSKNDDNQLVVIYNKWRSNIEEDWSVSKASARANRKRQRTSAPFSIRLLGVALIASFMAVGLVRQADAGTLKTIWDFKGGTADGEWPLAPLVAFNGALYGTTRNGGANGYGVVFKLTPNKAGDKWTETILYSFKGPPSDGRSPTNIVIDSTGAIYGSTLAGGSCANCIIGGVAYKLVEPASKKPPWTETILHQFTGGDGGATTDGSEPAGVTLAANGDLLGTTTSGGSSLNCGSDNGQPTGCGTIFQLTPPTGGGAPWTEIKIDLDKTNGAFPESPPTIAFASASNGVSPDSAAANSGYLAAATSQGGKKEEGPPSNTPGTGGISPSHLSQTGHGGPGNVFERAITFDNGDGNDPIAPLTPRKLTKGEMKSFLAWWAAVNSGGSATSASSRESSSVATTPFVFGAAAGGGANASGCPALANNGCGLVFGLTPPATGGGQWTQTILHQFSGGTDGALPEGALFIDPNGVLWGTTYGGDVTSDYGTIFSLTPDSSSSTGYDYAVVHNFASSDGANPSAGLIEVNGVLYGTATYGGSTGSGTVFAYTP